MKLSISAFPYPDKEPNEWWNTYHQNLTQTTKADRKVDTDPALRVSQEYVSADAGPLQTSPCRCQHSAEVCVYHRLCVFMRGLQLDLCFLQPLSPLYPECYWLMSDVPASWKSYGQFVFNYKYVFAKVAVRRPCSGGPRHIFTFKQEKRIKNMKKFQLLSHLY